MVSDEGDNQIQLSVAEKAAPTTTYWEPGEKARRGSPAQADPSKVPLARAVAGVQREEAAVQPWEPTRARVF